MTYLKGKRIVITGASSGIGEALAYALSERCAQLVLVSRTESELKRVQARCRRPTEHHIRVMDLENTSLLESQIDDIWRHIGPIDILINNAGISHRYLAQEGCLELDEKIMAVNFFSAIALSKPTLERMLARGQGHIVCVSSLAGLIGVERRSIYSASKHALRGYFESMRHELYRRPIKITMAYPGYVRTNLPKNALLKNGEANGLQERTHIRGTKVETCAEHIARAIERGQPEIIVAQPLERAAILVARYLPAVFRWLFPLFYRS